jgi:hypothetical protein
MGLDLSTAAGLTAVKTLLPLLPSDTLKQLGVRRLVQKPGDMVLTCPVSDGWGIALGRSMGARLKVQFEYSMVRYGAVRYGAVRCGTALTTAQCSAVQCKLGGRGWMAVKHGSWLLTRPGSDGGQPLPLTVCCSGLGRCGAAPMLLHEGQVASCKLRLPWCVLHAAGSGSD